MTTQVATQGDSVPLYSTRVSENFAAWLHASGATLAVTTYQIGKLFLIGAPAANRLSVTERTFQRCLGVTAVGSSLYLAGLNNILRFSNVVPPGQSLEGHDAVYVPQVAWFTGDVFAHDVGVLPSGRPIFVNTLFSCLATVDEQSSFRPVWQPKFITALRPEDRCHLNGLAMEDGAPRYVTAVATTDAARAWREQRVGNGCVIDVATGEVVASGLTMPHSPRLHDGRLYISNAGTGEVGEIELASGRFNPIAFCPGFVRGLGFVGNDLLVGLSLPRQHRDFSGLPLDDRLKQAGQAPQCMVQVIDMKDGTAAHSIALGGVVRELYDITCIPNHRTPMVVGFAQDQINRMIQRGRDISIDELLAEPARDT
jgi:uncharacterized protein (TIGR03032 family)